MALYCLINLDETPLQRGRPIAWGAPDAREGRWFGKEGGCKATSSCLIRISMHATARRRRRAGVVSLFTCHSLLSRSLSRSTPPRPPALLLALYQGWENMSCGAIDTSTTHRSLPAATQAPWGSYGGHGRHTYLAELESNTQSFAGSWVLPCGRDALWGMVFVGEWCFVQRSEIRGRSFLANFLRRIFTKIFFERFRVGSLAKHRSTVQATAQLLLDTAGHSKICWVIGSSATEGRSDISQM